jgi:purine-nucleoside phosphorylase
MNQRQKEDELRTERERSNTVYNIVTVDEERLLLKEAAEYLRGKGVQDPEVGIILGSGLGGYADRLSDAVHIPYDEIPGFASSTAPGHSGELVCGGYLGKSIMLMSGRYHHYEGYSMRTITFPVFLMNELGVTRLVITNASGAINRDFRAGDLMVVSDHINMSGDNPLIGPNLLEDRPRFPDMTDLYCRELRSKLISAAADRGIELKEGVYVMMNGPSFETSAEIRFLETIGGDAVGMSSVPEAIAAGYAGMDVIAVSCLSNMAAGILDQPLTSEEVFEATSRIAGTFADVVDLAVTI